MTYRDICVQIRWTGAWVLLLACLVVTVNAQSTQATIVGRITTPSLKARAEDFGELELRPGRLLTLHCLTGDERKEILRKMLICCEETRDDKSALEACLLVLESDPRISFGKYDYLVAHDLIATTEDFIERAATKSSVRGQPYEVKCGSGAAVTSGSS